MMTDRQIQDIITQQVSQHQEKKRVLITRAVRSRNIETKIARLSKNNRLVVELTDGGANVRIETYYLDGSLLISFVESKTPYFKDGVLGIDFRYEMYEAEQGEQAPSN